MFDSSPVGTTTRALIGLSPQPPYSVPLLDPGDGSYTFMHTQPGSKAPVTYDPCEVIEVQINPEGAPGRLPGVRRHRDRARVGAERAAA